MEGDVTSRAVGIADAKPDDDPEGGVFYLLLGTYAIVDDTLIVASDDVGAQSFELCGGKGGSPNWGPA